MDAGKPIPYHAFSLDASSYGAPQPYHTIKQKILLEVFQLGIILYLTSRRSKILLGLAATLGVLLWRWGMPKFLPF